MNPPGICYLRSWSTLVPVMACYPMAPSHYQRREPVLTKSFNEVLWYSTDLRAMIPEVHKISVHKRNLKITLKIAATSVRGQWVNSSSPSAAYMRQEDTFTVFEIYTWLPDFIMGMNPFRNWTAWTVWVEATCHIGNRKTFSSISINRQFKS